MNDYSGDFITKRRNFSMVSNTALRDKKLSLRAKGLYSIIQSFLDIEGFKLFKNYLVTQSKDSKNTFDIAWKELKEKGYLIQHRVNGKDGKIIYKYELLDVPENVPSVNTPDMVPQPKITDMVPQPKIPCMVKPVDGETIHGEMGCINNTINKNNTISNNTSIISIEDVMKQIGCGGLEEPPDYIASIAMIMVEVLNTDDSKTFRIEGKFTKASEVKERFRNIRYSDVDYAALMLRNMDRPIKNMKSFMITTLYNAPLTSGLFYLNTRLIN